MIIRYQVIFINIVNNGTGTHLNYKVMFSVYYWFSGYSEYSGGVLPFQSKARAYLIRSRQTIYIIILS